MNENKKILNAKLLWEKGDYLLAGKEIFENVDETSKPIWLASILSTITMVYKNDQIETLIELLKNKSQFDKAKMIFENLRDIKVKSHEPFLLSILDLAENSAKVTYNMSGQLPQYDKNAGWRIALNIKEIIANVNDNNEFIEELKKSYFQSE